MIHFKYSDKANQYVFLKIDGYNDLKAIAKLKEKMNLVDPICYLKSYQGTPYTSDFLYEYVQKSGQKVWYASIGLTQTICNILKENNYEYDGIQKEKYLTEFNLSFEEFKNIVDTWGCKFTPRPYQYKAAYNILKYKRSCSCLATRAGKTLISWILMRYAREYLGVHRILMVVPSIDLVKQGYSDFKEYGDYFNSECLWSGGKLVESSDLTIATFQTLVNFLDKNSKRYNPGFFDGNGIDRCGYDMVFVDETHRATAKSIKDIISQPFMSNVKIAFGMTGTLPKDFTIERHCINALLGPKIQELNPKDLQDGGYISDVKITQCRLQYMNEWQSIKDWIKCAEYCLSVFEEVPNKKNPKKMDHVPLPDPKFLIAYKKKLPQGILDAKWKIYGEKKPDTSKMTDEQWQQYQDLQYKHFLQMVIQESTKTNALHVEMMTVHFKERRIDWLIAKLKDCPNNTLILAQHREYIKYVYERVKEAYPDREVLYVIGGSKDRKIVKEVMKNKNNVILIAGYAICSTGITLSNLCHGFLFESFKSQVINMQSIGRGLGLSDMKDAYELYDVTDQFDPKIASNKIYLQGLQRCKLYREQKWSYSIEEIPLEDCVHIDQRIVDFVYKKKPKIEEKKKKEKTAKGSLGFLEQDLFK